MESSQAETQPEAPKREPGSIAEKKAIVSRIGRALAERDSFLVIGHKDPDEDCVSAMVAFALLASKFNKKAIIAIGPGVQENFDYLFNICRFNSIQVCSGPRVPSCSSLVLVDTAKPSMIDRPELFERMRRNPAILKIEIDHHLESDSRYFGDEGYSLVYRASSTCEIIGYLSLKLESDRALMDEFQIDELMTRNLVLAVLSGILGDTQMGKFISTKRELMFYRYFSSLFERLLAEKTRRGSANFSTKEQVFDTLKRLSDEEAACHAALTADVRELPNLAYAFFGPDASRDLVDRFGGETLVAVSKNLADELAERSGRLGLVAYFDDPSESPFAQFRLRRAHGYSGVDLREVLVRLGITNGGGHPGAIGFRVDRSAMDEERFLEMANAISNDVASR